ncbi:GDSL-type esterase/lipase family protein [Pedobacter miscanthi]|uniref:GDSL-type esterase/lipase family protein n=1 Tax=Pedobacter miscanthi TaxID=2259170 RepID=UPI0029308DB6|nr:GDSL-type esterase/lipase family protein [Pedobacter miscanthi]
MKKHFFLYLFLFFCSFSLYAQTQPNFYNDVKTIKNYDKMFQQPPNPILFVGSSSIRKWEHLQQAFGTYNVMNRGIGGAVIDDITFYLNDIVFPYKPRQIVLYVGENDVISNIATADTILNRTIRLYKGIRSRLPEVPIVYIALKPSPSRDKFMAKAINANRLIREYLSHEKNTAFVDIFSPMLKEGKSRPELFVGDMLHMNQQGYDIWEKALKPYLDLN